MARPLKENWMLFALVILLVTQLSALGLHSRAGAAIPSSRPGVGDDLGRLQLAGLGDTIQTLTFGETTLLLVFNSECTHCRSVAPVWKTWLQANDAHMHVVAVSPEPYEVARDFAVEYGWGVDVFSIDPGRRGSAAHRLASRTPWLFLIDGNGVILAEGHGERIAELTAEVQDVGQRKDAGSW